MTALLVDDRGYLLVYATDGMKLTLPILKLPTTKSGRNVMFDDELREWIDAVQEGQSVSYTGSEGIQFHVGFREVEISVPISKTVLTVNKDHLLKALDKFLLPREKNHPTSEMD